MKPHKLDPDSPDYEAHEAIYRHLREQGARGWDSDDEEYERMFALAQPGLPPVNASAARLLELGCGAGNFSLRCASLGWDVTGIDISLTAVEWAASSAREAGVAARFVQGSVVDLAMVANASFDAVVDGHCLHCIIGDDRAKCLSAVHRVLVPGGRFVVLTMCGEVTSEKLKAAFDAKSRLIYYKGRPSRYIGEARTIVEEVQQAGFTIEHHAVHPRSDAQGQDDLVIFASVPDASRLAGIARAANREGYRDRKDRY